MTVIEASSGTYRSRVDGTIVLQVEISPIHRADALALFGMPGTPLALAALKVGHAAKSDEPAEKPKGGTLAQSAGIISGEPKFKQFAETAGFHDPAQYIRHFCGITSRVELDHKPEAARYFATLMADYRMWANDRD